MCNSHDHNASDQEPKNHSRRDALKSAAAVSAAGIATAVAGSAVAQSDNPYAEPAEPALPPSNMELDLSRTALVVTDPDESKIFVRFLRAWRTMEKFL